MEPISPAIMIISLAGCIATFAPMCAILFNLGKYRGATDAAINKITDDINNIGKKLSESEHDYRHSLNDIKSQIDMISHSFTQLSTSITYIEKSIEELKRKRV